MANYGRFQCDFSQDFWFFHFLLAKCPAGTFSGLCQSSFRLRPSRGLCKKSKYYSCVIPTCKIVSSRCSVFSNLLRRKNKFFSVVKHQDSPDPATPTVAAPAPMNLAAESISRVTCEVWKDLTCGRSPTGVELTKFWLCETTAELNGLSHWHPLATWKVRDGKF